MKVSQNRNGFTLIEVIVALTVVAFGLAPLFISESRLLNQTGANFAAWSALIDLKNFMCTTAQKRANSEAEQKKITEEVNDITLSYDILQPPDGSSLKNIQNLQLIKATAEWDIFRPGNIISSTWTRYTTSERSSRIYSE